MKSAPPLIVVPCHVRRIEQREYSTVHMRSLVPRPSARAIATRDLRPPWLRIAKDLSSEITYVMSQGRKDFIGVGETLTFNNVTHALRPLNHTSRWLLSLRTLEEPDPSPSTELLYSLQRFSVVSGYPTSGFRYNAYKRAHSSTLLCGGL